MKIKSQKRSYDEVVAIRDSKKKTRFKSKRPNILFRVLLFVVSLPDLIATHFRAKKIGMEKLGRKEPALILMNHSSFIDLKIAVNLLFPRAFNIVCTSDGFVGKNWLMKQLGCIPTNKFVFDIGLVRDMINAVRKNKCSVLMYPEASYSFDGTATPLPDSLGGFVKMLGAPLIMIKTYGAFSRDPLYNGLQLRKVKVSADMKYLLSPEDIKNMTAEEIGRIIEEEFSFDNFRWQQENKIKIAEPFRADYLDRTLYKCPHCMAEGTLKGEGVEIECHSCGAKYELDEYGYLKALNVESKFDHIPDWYAWERECVREEIENGSYRLDVDVQIGMLVDTKCIYMVGDGKLIHTKEGFALEGCDGKLSYSQNPQSSYGLYADFNWYEIGDVICIGDRSTLYYCFPKNAQGVVAKTRLATEELYKMKRPKR